VHIGKATPVIAGVVNCSQERADIWKSVIITKTEGVSTKRDIYCSKANTKNPKSCPNYKNDVYNLVGPAVSCRVCICFRLPCRSNVATPKLPIGLR